MSFQLDTSTLSWFRGNQSLLLLLNVACFTEKEQIPMLHPLVWSNLNSKLRSTTLEASTLIITPQVFFPLFIRPLIWHFSHHIPLYVMFCRSLFVLLSFFFWPLCCLSFDLRILITPLVSSNSSLFFCMNYYILVIYT